MTWILPDYFYKVVDKLIYLNRVNASDNIYRKYYTIKFILESSSDYIFKYFLISD